MLRAWAAGVEVECQPQRLEVLRGSERVGGRARLKVRAQPFNVNLRLKAWRCFFQKRRFARRRCFRHSGVLTVIPFLTVAMFCPEVEAFIELRCADVRGTRALDRG